MHLPATDVQPDARSPRRQASSRASVFIKCEAVLRPSSGSCWNRDINRERGTQDVTSVGPQ